LYPSHIFFFHFKPPLRPLNLDEAFGEPITLYTQAIYKATTFW
jgi:hypothetical protein